MMLEMKVLGKPEIRVDGQIVQFASQTTLALTIYLALEGPVNRSRLNQLFWGNQTDIKQKKLNSELHRIRSFFGPNCVRIETGTSDEEIGLIADVEVDWREAHSKLLMGSLDEAKKIYSGIFLEGLHLPAAQAFSDWVQEERENIRAVWKRALAELEHRKLGRKTTITRPQVKLPPSVLRPPEQIGRESTIRRMQDAWNRGQAIFVAGEPGIGKSRLILDFAENQHEKPLLLFARPSEVKIPYAAAKNAVRRMLEVYQELELDEWVRQELARLVPELGKAPEPMRSDQDRLRLLEAISTLVDMLIQRGLRSIVVDDLQYADAASIEALFHALSPHWGNSESLKCLFVFRSKALEKIFEEKLRETVEQDLSIWIEVRALDPGQVEIFLYSLKLPNLELTQVKELASVLTRSTGGNPQFLLETLKDLIEKNQLSQGVPQKILPSEKISSRIRRRLERLSISGQRLLQVLALTGATFDTEVAASALEWKPSELTLYLEELEGAQFITERRFTHDLNYETTLQCIPSSIRPVLHRSLATRYEDRDVDSAKIAYHWSESGEAAKAAPYWLAAAKTAESQYRFVEGADFYGRASDGFMALGNADQGNRTLKKKLDLMQHFDLGPNFEAIVDQLMSSADTPWYRAGVWEAKFHWLWHYKRYAEAELAARTGYQEALESKDAQQQTGLLMDLGGALWGQGKIEESALTFEQALMTWQNWGDTEIRLREQSRAQIASNLGILRNYQARYDEAFQFFSQAQTAFEEIGNKIGKADVFTNWGATLIKLGRANQAVKKLQEATSIYQNAQGMADLERRALTQLAEAYRDQAEFTSAFEAISQALELVEKHNIPKAKGRILEIRGSILLILGAFDQARSDLEFALQEASIGDIQARVMLRMAQLDHWCGRNTNVWIEKATALISKSEDKVLHIQFYLQSALVTEPRHGLDFARQAQILAATHQLSGLELVAHTRISKHLLALNQLNEASKHSEQAIKMSQEFYPTGGYMGEVWVNYCHALLKSQDSRAAQQVYQAKIWLVAISEKKIPTMFQANFRIQSDNQSIYLFL